MTNNGIEAIEYPYGKKKKKRKLIPTSHYVQKSEMENSVVEENIGRKHFHDIGVCQNFLNITVNKKHYTQKIIKMDCFKIRNFYSHNMLKERKD